MRFATVFALVAALSANSLFAAMPQFKPGNKYGAGRVVATSASTTQRQGREYTGANGTHRRVLVYGTNGSFKGFAKRARVKGDAQHGHYMGK